MKKIVLIPLLILGITSACNPDDPEKIKQKIVDHEQKINQYEKKIDKLKEKLRKDSIFLDKKFQTPVIVKKMEPTPFKHYFEVNGTVEAEQDAFISPEMNGQIATIHVKEGQRASKGQLLVSLKTDVTESNIQEVKTSLELANKMYEKQKDLWEQKVGSEVQYLQAKNQKESLEARLNTLRAQLDMARVKAPFAGIVEEIFQKEGELGTPGRQIIQLVNLNKLKLNASVSESYLSMVEAGDTVRVTFPAFPGMVKYLPISRTGKVIDPASRTFDIELAMRNPAEKLKPNMLAVVRLNDYTNPSAFVVPSNALSQDIKGKFLFTAQVTDSITLAEKVYVKPGKSYGNQSEIQKGLKPGDKVVVSGYNLVSSGSELNIKEVR